MLNWFLGAIVGYIIHDAIQPTALGEVLDKVALPGDLFVKGSSPNENITGLKSEVTDA